MGPRLINRGNFLKAASKSKCISASMGPRLINRGNLMDLYNIARFFPRFNGAAVDQPRK